MAYVLVSWSFPVGLGAARLLSKIGCRDVKYEVPTSIHVVCSVRLRFGVRMSEVCKVRTVGDLNIPRGISQSGVDHWNLISSLAALLRVFVVI